MDEKCEKVIPEDVLLGIANFEELLPCKIPEKDKKKEVLTEEQIIAKLTKFASSDALALNGVVDA